VFVLIAATGGGTLLLDLLWCLGGVRDMISHLGLEDNKGTRGALLSSLLLSSSSLGLGVETVEVLGVFFALP